MKSAYVGQVVAPKMMLYSPVAVRRSVVLFCRSVAHGNEAIVTSMPESFVKESLMLAAALSYVPDADDAEGDG